MTVKQLDDITIVIKYKNGQTNTYTVPFEDRDLFEEDYDIMVRKICAQQNYFPKDIEVTRGVIFKEV